MTQQGMRGWLRRAAWAGLVGLSTLTFRAQDPPRIVARSAPAEQFSAERALDTLTALTERPHPIGSPENAQVAERLRRRLSDYGLEVQERVTPACTRLGPLANCGHVQNLVAVLPGAHPGGPAVLLSAHYDSVPSSPGAGDDGTGVAALVETARALRHSPRLEHDVIFAFVDGEEVLCLGASALSREPLFERVFVAINFEARGNRGPSVLIDTTPKNRALIHEVAGALSAPALNSVYVTLASVLPNGTDAELYRRKGPKVLSFALADGLPYYHHGTDTAANLELASLQHQGVNALDLARRFGNLEPTVLDSDGDSVFFDVLGLGVARYPYSWARLGWLALLALSGWALWERTPPSSLAASKGRLRSTFDLALGALSLLALGLGAGVLAGALAWLATLGQSQESSYAARWPVLGGAMLAGVAMLRVAYPWLRRGGEQASLKAAGTLWLVLTAALVGFAPGASHLFFWPLLGVVLALLGSKRWSTAQALSPLGLVPLVFFFTGFARATAITFGAGAAGLWGLMLGLSWPFLTELPEGDSGAESGPIGRIQPKWTSSLLAGLATILLFISTRFSAAPPTGTAITYILADGGPSYFATADSKLTAWHTGFFPDGSTYARSPALPSLLPLHFAAAPPAAPSVGLPAPVVTEWKDVWSGETRRVELRVQSQRGATELTVEELTGAVFEHIAYAGAEVDPLERVSEKVDTEFLRRFAGVDNGGRLLVALHGVPREGVPLHLVTRAAGPLVFRLSDQTQGLPGVLAARAQRPPHITTGFPGDITQVVARPIELGSPN